MAKAKQKAGKQEQEAPVAGDEGLSPVALCLAKRLRACRKKLRKIEDVEAAVWEEPYEVLGGGSSGGGCGGSSGGGCGGSSGKAPNCRVWARSRPWPSRNRHMTPETEHDAR